MMRNHRSNVSMLPPPNLTFFFSGPGRVFSSPIFSFAAAVRFRPSPLLRCKTSTFFAVFGLDVEGRRCVPAHTPVAQMLIDSGLMVVTRVDIRGENVIARDSNFVPGRATSRRMPGTFEGIPNYLWLYLSELDSSFRIHCILSAINHRFRTLLTTQTTRLCWPVNSAEERTGTSSLDKMASTRMVGVLSSYRVTRPPFALFLRRCAASLQWLSISAPFDNVDAAAFVEADLKGVVFPQLHTLNFPLAPLWFLRLCPQLRDLTTSRELFPSGPSFDKFLRDFTNLQSLKVDGIPLSYFGLRGQPRHPHSAMVRATARGEGIAVGTPASVRGLTLEHFDPEDLPVLLADWPNLERLCVTMSRGATDPLGVLAAAIQRHTPYLRSLELSIDIDGRTDRVPILPEELQPFDSVLTQLTAAVIVRAPRLLLPAGLRVCDLELRTDLPEVTLDLPRVEELTLSASKSKKITLCCPALVIFRANIQPLSPCAWTIFASECRMPHLCTLDFDHCQSGASLDLDNLWKTELPDFWRVPNLVLSLKGGVSHLRLSPVVKRLTVTATDLAGLSAPGLRFLRLRILKASPKPLEMDTPQLEELEITSDRKTFKFSSEVIPPLLHTLVILCDMSSDAELRQALSSLIHQCRHTLSNLVMRFRAPPSSLLSIQECPALRQLWCDVSVELRSPCPFLEHIGLTAPTVYRRASSLLPPPPGTALGGVRAAFSPAKVMLINNGINWTLNDLKEGPLFKIVQDAVPSVLLERLRQDRPDVLIFSCPCISDALLLRTARAPNLRPLYALDLARIFQQSCAPRVVLHLGCAPPHAFLGDLFKTCKQHGLLLAGVIRLGSDLLKFLNGLADLDISSAVRVIKEDSGIDDAGAIFPPASAAASSGPAAAPPSSRKDCSAPSGWPRDDHRPSSEPSEFSLSARELRAHFPDVRLGELEGALERRSHEFACQCPASTPPRFRLAWACKQCTGECPDHDPIESSIVLPDPASPLACLPRIRENASRLVGDCDLADGVPNFCFRCLLNGMASDKRAKLDIILAISRAVPLAECAVPQAISEDGFVIALLSIPVVHDIKGLLSPLASRKQWIANNLDQIDQRAKIREFRPDLVIYVNLGLRQAISIRGEAGMTKPLTWLGPDELLDCFGDCQTPTADGLSHLALATRTASSPLSVPNAVLLACCNSLALGDHLLRGRGGLERVVATADELTDVEASRFLSTLLVYAPHNPMPAALDEILQVSFNQAQHARATYRDLVDPTTPLVLISRPRNLGPQPPLLPRGQQPREDLSPRPGDDSPAGPCNPDVQSTCEVAFSRGPTLAEAIHATRALALANIQHVLSGIPLRCTCGCPEGPQFAIEFAKGCVRPAVPEGPPTAVSADASQQERGPNLGAWCMRCTQHVPHGNTFLSYAQRCQRCGQAAFIIPRDLQAAFKEPPGTPSSVTIIDIGESLKSCPLEKDPMLKISRVVDALPSVLLERLRQDRPDVLVFSCPCISDALLLRTARAPNLRPLYALDLARIIQQSGAPVRAILYSPHPRARCTPDHPDAFILDLFEICKRQGLLAAAIIKNGDLFSILKLFKRGISAAVDVRFGEFFVSERHRPPPRLSDTREQGLKYARELQAHFPDVPLGELEGALERRSHEFACQCPASIPPRFRLVWACQECSKRCRPGHDPVESSIVLPDLASPLACLPFLEANMSRRMRDLDLDSYDAGVPNFCFRCLLNSGDMWDRRALPLAECVGCHTRGLRMRNEAIAALPPFDEKPFLPPPPFGSSHWPSHHVREGPALRVLCITINPSPTEAKDHPLLARLSTPQLLARITAALNHSPSFGLEMSLLCEPSAQAIKAEICRFRPDLVLYVSHGLRQAISIRGAAGMTKPLTWLGPDELLRCFEDETPIPAPSPRDLPLSSSPLPRSFSVPHAVLLVCCNSLALGDHLLRGRGGLERVVATADELTDVEASRFLSTLLVYAPHNPMPAALDEILQVSFNQAQHARATYQSLVDPTTPLVLLRPRHLVAAQEPSNSKISGSSGNMFSRGPTLAEAIHATRALACPLEDLPNIPLRYTCGCPEGPKFAIESAASCMRPAAPEGPPVMLRSSLATVTAIAACIAMTDASHQDQQREENHKQKEHECAGQWCMRCFEHMVSHCPPFRFAQRCQRCGQAAFIIPSDPLSAFKTPACLTGPEKKLPPSPLKEQPPSIPDCRSSLESPSFTALIKQSMATAPVGMGAPVPDDPLPAMASLDHPWDE
ncbi:hypothetical protein PAPYR_8159 [Paratrimastix pyriformis]|uniref:CHAT domain-containing protein n=1 Tax=Paratrimastix pyriformis TaxID=342808 RepID=A0ABQ8UDS0_9EUKA|nr:hypothetical protein PAPYR_8159 [Paratrimastix pyriformis]